MSIVQKQIDSKDQVPREGASQGNYHSFRVVKQFDKVSEDDLQTSHIAEAFPIAN